MNVLFVCVQNSGRLQMAEAPFRQATNGVHEARSAGKGLAETRAIRDEIAASIERLCAKLEGKVGGP